MGCLLIGASLPVYATVKNPPEGGTWNYGTETSGDKKFVWSNYVHPSKRHSSTVIIGPQNVKVWAEANFCQTLVQLI
ncbi:MAG: lactococcin 972 family bacteriocin [Coriobacteriales bacterium]|nr:lactococcin 972 family bacteriocin [Coriobacteriales bacterium]